MKIYRFWASAELSAENKDGKRLLLKKWGGSNDSASAAKSTAERAVRDLKDRILTAALTPSDQYAYGLRDVPEEFIREISPESAVTRNRMGCLVLNTTELFFADIDIFDPNIFAKLFRGASRQKNEDAALAKLNAFMNDNPSLGARIYRTRGGFRYIFTHAPAKVNNETLGWLTALDGDELYNRLCKQQDCFRARLSPKPWRLPMKLPNRYPRDTDKDKAAFENWLGDYNSRSESFAVCKFVGTAGRDRIHEALAALVREHDRATRSDSALPLA